MTLNLSRPQKAAAILVAMGKPSAGKLLKFFKQEELKALVDAARALRTIPQSDLERIVAEFEAEFAEGAGLLDSGDKMDTIINETLTPEEASVIRGEREAKRADDNQPPPVWPALETLEPARLGTFLAGEHPQTAALVLCNMAPQGAAGVLMTLPKAVRGEVVKRMLAMNSVPEKAKRIVEDQIRSRVLAENSVRDNSAGQARVASLLNELDREQLDEVIEDMQAAGASDIEAVKARLFSFDDIVLLSQKARVTLFDGIATDLVTTALRQCGGELKESILSALGQRARRMIESELSMEAQGVTAADILKARKTIAATALRLAGDRLLELPSAESVPEAA